ncbi:MAG: DUF2130 domain-containing protein [Prevotella sp.]|nr:DUF2130 domain-containing protein [Prevotella sp.]
MEQIKCPKCGEVFQIDDTQYAKIVKQINDKELAKRIKEKEREIEERKNNEIEFVRLQFQIERQKLDTIIAQNETQKQLAVKEALEEKEHEIVNQEKQVIQLEEQLKTMQKDYEIKEKDLHEAHKKELRLKDEEIAQYKDFKAKQSVKLLGETLEQHCEIEFNKLRSLGFNKSYFEKDNDARTGSKGDYIFKELDDDNSEIISIMFEMKNEADTTITKKKNEDFFKELDKDRKEKGCEYAVLVSMLEADNELYNAGIVDVSHKYEKMFVVRPQFFIPIITLLRNAALKSANLKKSLIAIQNQNIDLSNFEHNMNEFKEKFSKNYNRASTKFNNAIDEIDKTIKNLQKIKDDLLGSENQFRLANEKAESLSIKQLTHNSPTIRAKFEELHRN